MVDEQRELHDVDIHGIHETDITWDQYVELASDPNFMIDYKDQIFFVKDVEFSDVIDYLLDKVNTLTDKYNRLVAAYQAEVDLDFDPDAEEVVP